MAIAKRTHIGHDNTEIASLEIMNFSSSANGFFFKKNPQINLLADAVAYIKKSLEIMNVYYKTLCFLV